MRRNAIRTSMMLVTILLLPLVVLVAQETSALLIEGQQGQAKVIQVQGKNYVEVNEFARITGGSLRFVGNQIVLSLPGSDTQAQAAQSEPQPAAGLSKAFLTGGIETIKDVVEWHAGLEKRIVVL